MKEHCKHRQLSKWAKLGIGLAAFTVLGGLVVPEGLEGLEPIVVQAEEQASRSLTVYYRLKTGENLGDEENLQEVTYQLKPGETIDIRQAYPDYQFVSSESGQTVYHYEDLNATFAIHDTVTYQRKDYKPLSDTLPSLNYTVRYVVETDTGLQDIATPKNQELKGGGIEFVSGPEIDGYYRLTTTSEVIRYEDIQSGQKEVLLYYKPIEAAPLTYQVTLVHAVTGQILETSQKEILEGRSQDLSAFIPEGYTSTKSGSDNLTYDEVKAGKTSVTILCVPFAEEAIGVLIEYRTQEGVLEEAYLTVSPGENLVVKAKGFAGYELVSGTASERTIPYNYAKNSKLLKGMMVDALVFQYQKIGTEVKHDINFPIHKMTEAESKAFYEQQVLLYETLHNASQLDSSLYTEESQEIFAELFSYLDLYHSSWTDSSMKLEIVSEIESLAPPIHSFNLFRKDIKRIENGMAALVLKDKGNEVQSDLSYKIEWFLDGKLLESFEFSIQPGQSYSKGVIDKGGTPSWLAFAEPSENSPQVYHISYDKVAAGENYYRFDLVSLANQGIDEEIGEAVTDHQPHSTPLPTAPQPEIVNKPELTGETGTDESSVITSNPINSQSQLPAVSEQVSQPSAEDTAKPLSPKNSSLPINKLPTNPVSSDKKEYRSASGQSQTTSPEKKLPETGTRQSPLDLVGLGYLGLAGLGLALVTRRKKFIE
ncbi:TPA: hypothetical protein ACGO6G_000233 [Streptococcus suis]